MATGAPVAPYSPPATQVLPGHFVYLHPTHVNVHVAVSSGGTNTILEFLTIFVLAAFVGFEVISKVPSILHTPLMSGSNAIHGVILVGAMLILGHANTTPEEALGFVAVILATLNVVGGFVVTDRMLEMFKGRGAERSRPPRGTGGAGDSSEGEGDAGSSGGAGA